MASSSMKRLKRIFVLILLFSISNVNANTLPTLIEYLEPQLKCDSSHPMNKIIDESLHGGLDTSTVIILDRLKYTELKQPESKDKKTFQVSYVAKAIFQCGKKVLELNETRNFIADMERNKTTKKVSFLYNEDKTKKIDSDLMDQEGGYLFFDADSNHHRTCLVKVEDLVKNVSLINVDKLCEGRTEKEKEYTIFQIKKMVSRWKNERGIK